MKVENLVIIYLFILLLFIVSKESFSPPKPELLPVDLEEESLHWNLNGVDMESFITLFYKDYSPSNIGTIDDVLHRYEGEEQDLIDDLCGKYKVSRSEMEIYLNNSRNKKRSIKLSSGTLSIDSHKQVESNKPGNNN